MSMNNSSFPTMPNTEHSLGNDLTSVVDQFQNSTTPVPPPRGSHGDDEATDHHLNGQQTNRVSDSLNLSGNRTQVCVKQGCIHTTFSMVNFEKSLNFT